MSDEHEAVGTSHARVQNSHERVPLQFTRVANLKLISKEIETYVYPGPMQTRTRVRTTIDGDLR